MPPSWHNLGEFLTNAAAESGEGALYSLDSGGLLPTTKIMWQTVEAPRSLCLEQTVSTCPHALRDRHPPTPPHAMRSRQQRGPPPATMATAVMVSRGDPFSPALDGQPQRTVFCLKVVTVQPKARASVTAVERSHRQSPLLSPVDALLSHVSSRLWSPPPPPPPRTVKQSKIRQCGAPRAHRPLLTKWEVCVCQWQCVVT